MKTERTVGEREDKGFDADRCVATDQTLFAFTVHIMVSWCLIRAQRNFISLDNTFLTAD